MKKTYRPSKSRGGSKSADRQTYVRTVSLSELTSPAVKPGKKLRLTVGAMYRGEICMQDEAGTQYVCAREHARGALHGDVVSAVLIGYDRVLVKQILTHAHEQITGVLRMSRRGYVLTPLERRLPEEIEVAGDVGGALQGDIVTAKVTRWIDEGGLLVKVTQVIGSFEKAPCALEALIAANRLPTQFSPEALAQADALRPASLRDDPQRTDLRDLLTFTIDGRDAKDFDDAVSIEPLGGGAVRIGVHIADVGHYVPRGSWLDKEAYLRGTSVYFPGRVLPMLPEQLSNGVCSLRPQEDKFTLSAMMDIEQDGDVQNVRILRTITRSDARLVYDDVNAFFDGDQDAVPQEVQAALMEMKKAARLLRAQRQAQGCIDFDTDEPAFVLNEQGEPVEMVKRVRGEAERMIEDFMLLANMCVARYVRARGLPVLYRVHEKPDPEKLSIFKDFLGGIGVDGRRIGRDAQPGDIRAVLEQTKDRPEFSVISALALRSMQKARYDVSPLGHYGLAMPDYCHFTSPIRRYPDLVVSRALSAALTGGRVTLTGKELEEAAVRSSDCERAAAEAERAADKMMMARFMASHVGEVFDGTVSGVTDWGVYVALPNGAEGFIHVRTLEDWFDFDERRMTLRGERTGASFFLGQPLEVRVEHVELAASSVDLALTAPLRPAVREKSARKKERERMRGFRR